MNAPVEKTGSSPKPAAEKDGRRLHFLGVCGKAMGGIAAALASEGWRITGSDEKCYEPMKSYLEARGISIRSPYGPQNVPSSSDLVIVGKRVAAVNPELLHVLGSGLPHCSFPQFLSRSFLSKSRNAVVAGGVGKTTTSSMLAWILEESGLKPDFLIGGQPRNFGVSARLSGGKSAVLEGDEYSSCFDDPKPKFLHYHPEVAIITNIVEDHPDIYRTFEDLCGAFAALVETLPAHGCLIVSDGDEASAKLAPRARCKVIATGFGPSAANRITGMRLFPDKSCFRLQHAEFEIPLCGEMNVRNAAMAAIAASHFGIPPVQAARALGRFQGVYNRQEEIVAGSCVLVRDKASHPHALEELARAMRQRFPGRRLVSVIQPRATGGKQWIYQRDLPLALSNFDKVILTSAYEHNPQNPQGWASDPFCLDLLAASLRSRPVDVAIARGLPEIPETIRSHIQERDVVVVTVLEQSKSLMDVIRKCVAEAKGEAQS